MARIKLLSLLMLIAFRIEAQASHKSILESPRSAIELPPMSQNLTIDIGDVPAVSHWAIGVKVANDRPASLTATVISYTQGPSGRAPSQMISGIRDLSSSEVSIKTGSIAIVSQLVKGSSLLVYVSLPALGAITVSQNSKIVAQAAVQDSLIIRDGAALSGPLHGFGDLLLTLGRSPSFSTEATGSMLSNGRYAPTISELRQHLANYADLGSASKPDAPGIFATVRLRIDKSGGVVEILSNHISAAPLSQIGPTMKMWSFTPFIVNGQAMEATIVLPIFIDSEGRLFSAISPNSTLQ